MKIVAYKGRGKQPWRWRLVASNGQIMADSAEGYARKQNLRRALVSLGKQWQRGYELRVIWR
jgi:uncharacterized protein YegP (UPF0339 family)